MAVRNVAAIAASGRGRSQTRKNRQGRHSKISAQAAKGRIVEPRIRISSHPRFAFRGSGIVSSASVVLDIWYCGCEESA